ncbi:putative L-kynurenine/alpha-aminoadipate aminotransferase [Durotheca rogersii]|uniref:putative L-kynurenine/alpha-aminoadipate aminotransferase n=1 Tax=Durotheca rogersii TaxID=419775 RepID=UPI00221F9992|nr:putative L-kynurenine/alpha-aminoadipate aminotransferase [Durotheca rogersii]KAI5867052.1 putative L-kynurenine/alpha-aminoadipate aminotransferase [Durotheca rogersii]
MVVVVEQNGTHAAAITPKRLTLDGIGARRAKAGRLVASTASYSDSDMFKSPYAYGKPKAKRWEHLFSQESLARGPCVLKQAAKYLKQPGMISLGGGLPAPENFPIDSLSLRVPTPPYFTEAETHGPLGQDITIGKYDARNPDGESVFDLSIGMNYGQSVGAAPLVRWVTEHTELVNAPPYSDWRCALTVGSTGALEQALRIFCDRARGDSILTEEFSFSTALETALPLGIRVFGVGMDGEGLVPERLDEVLSNWDPAARGGARKPTVLYTVPSGQNPTGATQSLQRRREVYKVCQKHDVYIFEDEPYYYLQMPAYNSSNGHANGHTNGHTNGHANGAVALPAETIEEFLESLVPSLLSIDTDGRVLRMDSFSKVVVPGSRVGWITASEEVVDRFIRHAECCNQGPSGISQLVMHKLVDETWGHEGYLRWLMHLRREYTRRRDTILAACEKYLPRDLVSWVPPAAGMFLWLQIDPAQHPRAGAVSLLEIEEQLFFTCIAKGVLATRGSWFRAEPDRPLSGLFFRTTFAAASESNIAAAVERFGAAVREVFGRS